MAGMITTKTTASIDSYLDSISNPELRKECETLRKIMSSVTKDKGAMWGASIVGFGSMMAATHTKNPYEWFRMGFAARKSGLAIYLTAGWENFEDECKQLGKSKIGVGCMTVKSLSNINTDQLKAILTKSLSL